MCPYVVPRNNISVQDGSRVPLSRKTPTVIPAQAGILKRKSLIIYKGLYMKSLQSLGFWALRIAGGGQTA